MSVSIHLALLPITPGCEQAVTCSCCQAFSVTMDHALQIHEPKYKLFLVKHLIITTRKVANISLKETFKLKYKR